MKANKALKRLTKIETLITDVTERFSQGSLHIRGALQEAKAALGRAKAAVSSQASSRTAKTSKTPSKKTPEPAKGKLSPAVKQAMQQGVSGRVAQKNEATANTKQSKKKAVPARKKAPAKTMATKTPAATMAKKRVPIKKTAKKHSAPKKATLASIEIPATVETTPDVEAQTEPAAQISVGE